MFRAEDQPNTWIQGFQRSARIKTNQSQYELVKDLVVEEPKIGTRGATKKAAKEQKDGKHKALPKTAVEKEASGFLEAKKVYRKENN